MKKVHIEINDAGNLYIALTKDIDGVDHIWDFEIVRTIEDGKLFIEEGVITIEAQTYKE